MNFRLRMGLFATGVLLGLIAEQVLLFAVPLLIFQRTGTVTTLGLAFALEWIPALLMYPVAGLLADRDGGARLFSLATAVRALAVGTTALVCLLRPDLTVVTLVVDGVILSLLMAPVRMSVEKLTPHLARGERLARAQSLVQNMELLAMALGPALALLGAHLLGKVWLLAVAAGLFALAACCWVPLPRGLRSTGRSTVRGNLAELGLGLRLLIGTRPVLLLAVLNFSINLVFATALSQNAAVVTHVFRAPESSFAVLNACVGVAGLLNLMITPLLLRRVAVQALGWFGFALLSGALVLLGLAPSFAAYAPAYVAALTGVAYFNVFNRTQRVRVIPQEHLGKVMGPFYLLNLLSYPLGGLLVAGFGESLGSQQLVALLAVALAVAGTGLLIGTVRAFHQALGSPAPAAAKAEA